MRNHASRPDEYLLTVAKWLEWNREYGHVFQTVRIISPHSHG